MLVVTRAQFEALLHRHPPLGFRAGAGVGGPAGTGPRRSVRRLEDRNQALQAALDELHAAQAELVEKQMLEHELALARDIQMSLLPPDVPVVPGFDFGARLLPMSQVGGDFYDFIPLEDGEPGYCRGRRLGPRNARGVDHGDHAGALVRSEAARSRTPSQVLRSSTGNC